MPASLKLISRAYTLFGHDCFVQLIMARKEGQKAKERRLLRLLAVAGLHYVFQKLAHVI